MAVAATPDTEDSVDNDATGDDLHTALLEVSRSGTPPTLDRSGGGGGGNLSLGTTPRGIPPGETPAVEEEEEEYRPRSMAPIEGLALS